MILGFLARAVPQMNLFIIGLPVKILVGFVFLILSLSIIVNFYTDLFDQLFAKIVKILEFFGSG